ncbi:HpcH/HpaI aldolase/citrate lyase family protein [Aquibium oceanicum]|uniref:CoA ester lyase n=1 Tax=Aquibium oceanicum TaxID=1670800 RepID=A0A1L3SSA1_9HYPH|nr:CoA ester lyase [Aquibium oceanicum]APH72250.1 CoA ester lyase [Aquibium oceanicum]
MRSMLFVPGDSERKLEKSLQSGADALIVDLEDSVAPASKEAARKVAAGFLSARTRDTGPALYVRVNDFTTGLTDDDLAAVIAARPDGIMLPKSASGHDVTRLSVKLRVHEAEAGLDDGVIRIIPLITETAAGLLAAGTYDASLPRLVGVTWGAEDLSADVGARTARDANGRFTEVFRLARAMTILAAAKAQTLAIDTVFTDFRDMEGLRTECLEAERDGFSGKLAIHPAQVPVINEAFTPSAEAIGEAEAIVAAFAGAGDVGVVGIGGKMYDRPHLRRAERLLARAQA